MPGQLAQGGLIQLWKPGARGGADLPQQIHSLGFHRWHLHQKRAQFSLRDRLQHGMPFSDASLNQGIKKPEQAGL
jgi:hypothetical protein